MVSNIEEFSNRVEKLVKSHPNKRLKFAVVVDEGRLSNKDAKDVSQNIIDLHHAEEDAASKGRIVAGVGPVVARAARKAIADARGKTLGRASNARTLEAFAKSIKELG